jgi:hypothetical protein
MELIAARSTRDNPLVKEIRSTENILAKDSNFHKGLVMIRSASFLTFALLAAVITPANASDGVTPLAIRAMERGYGKTCSLEMIPVARGGYYPCLDFGPYRLVKQYGRITGYVVREGKQPFLVFRTEEGLGGFTVKGPWEADMPAKIALFWNDVVEGRGQETKASIEIENERLAAEEYVSGLSKPPAAKPAPTSSAETIQAAPQPTTPEAGGILGALSGVTR